METIRLSSDEESDDFLSSARTSSDVERMMSNLTIQHVENRPERLEKSLFTVGEKDVYQDALQHFGQEREEEDLPEGVLCVSLLKHQQIALAWMVFRENSSRCKGGILADDQGLGKTISTIALIQKERLQQSSFKSNDSDSGDSLHDDDEEAVVAMDMKEIKAHGTRPKASAATMVRTVKAQPKKKTTLSSTPSLSRLMSKPAAGTLVVCPASVLKQWANELSGKVTKSAELSVLAYHENSRTKDPIELADYDVVVTTYGIVLSELVIKENTNEQGMANEKEKKKNKSMGPLAMVRWFRVVLDEAHKIKNYKSQTARCCWRLSAERRWCLSGTPIQNSIMDLYSYFRFLKYEPYSEMTSFRSMLKDPIDRDANQGYKKLQTVLRIVLLRRTKEMHLDGEPIIKLPPKTIQLSQIDFTKEERAFYLRLEENSRQTLKERSKKYIEENYMDILALLSQLRLACNHPSLLKQPQSFDDSLCEVGSVIAKEKKVKSVRARAGLFDHDLQLAKQLPLEIARNLLENLERGAAKCTICKKPDLNAVVATCGHVFCYDHAYDMVINNAEVIEKVCPASPHCGKEISRESLFCADVLKFCLWPELDSDATTNCWEPFSVCESSFISSKIQAAMDILNSIINTGTNEEEDDDTVRSIPSERAPAKVIIFTQWTGTLDLLERSLSSNHIEFRRLDGKMRLNTRERAVREFSTDPKVRAIIISLKAGNLGLNIVAANHVIMVDPWWNPTTEDQAVDRAHRIGQTRPVTVHRITVKDTVEDRILSLQEEKREMVQSVLGDGESGGGAAAQPTLTVEDIRYLFMV